MAVDPHAPVLESPLPVADNPPTVASIRRTADGSIDEDVYCLGCAYNLRGLSGDPVTCPECGKPNATGDLIIPAAAITLALRRMETAPTTCVGMSILAFFSLFVAVMCFAQNMSVLYPLIFIIGSLAIGLSAVWRMRTEFNARPGWFRILLEFHLVTAIMLPSAWVVVVTPLSIPRFQWFGVPLGTMIVISFLGLAGIAFGLSIYRASRRRLAAIQREAAVRMAKEILRTHLRHEM